MLNTAPKEAVLAVLPRVPKPAQYLGGEPICGGPGAQNPELLAPFVDVFVVGDGEESLPWLMDRWLTLKEQGGKSRADCIAELVGATTWAYAPQFYEPEYHADGTIAALNRT